MNYMEAIKCMDNGKKVRLNWWKPTTYIYLKEGEYYTDENEITRLTNYRDNILSENWEICKDWNLKDNCWNDSMKDFYGKVDVKKCRDLIIKDVDKFSELDIFDFKTIVNKRFGDL